MARKRTAEQMISLFTVVLPTISAMKAPNLSTRTITHLLSLSKIYYFQVQIIMSIPDYVVYTLALLKDTTGKIIVLLYVILRPLVPKN